MNKTTRGFTLIELLIVIVVIAILASISVVAYSGVQQRGKTAAIYANARQLATAMSLYGAETGTFPSQYNSCFGEAADFPATSDNNSGRCWNIRDEYNTVWSQASVQEPVNISSLLSAVTNGTSPRYDPVKLEDTDGYRHTVRGFWYSRVGSAPYTEGSISFAVPSDECPGDSVEFVEGYYVNGNICSIKISL